jgi:hypothetical protein
VKCSVNVIAKLKHAANIQWVLNDLDTEAIISRSANADEVYFGASVAKVFVAAALLNKQDGQFDRAQLTLLEQLRQRGGRGYPGRRLDAGISRHRTDGCLSIKLRTFAF